MVEDTHSTRPLSRRQRRAVWTGVFVVIGIAAVAAVLLGGYYQRRTAQYQPGEANPDITESLARDLPTDAPKPVFVDVTREAGLAEFTTFTGQRGSQLPEDMGPGAAWGDADNDGDDDLFLVSAGGPLNAPAAQLAPSALYENLGNGRFRRVTDFPEPHIVGMGAAWGDYDADGWVDLVVTGYNALLLYHNSHGRLTLDATFPNRRGFWSTPAWGDYDNDGRLDLYVCGYVQYVASDADRAKASEQYGTSVPFTLNPASYAPERNLLFHNVGRGRFLEAGEKLGVANPDGRSLSAVWHDFDGDGWLDLYVANDISDNVLYHNVRGRFEDVSHPAWVADHRGAMGLAVGDWNRDGDDDLFISHWIAQENALYDSLMTDQHALRFVDAADTVGLGQIALSVVGWGTEFLDWDADGWLDLAVANGSTMETERAPKRLVPQAAFLFWNRRGEYFYDLAPLVPAIARPRVARGLAVSDYDNDGDLDLLIVRSGEGVQLLRNDTPQGHWVEVVLRARAAPDGPPVVARGALAVAKVGSLQLRRGITNGSYLSQSTAVLHFGLGGATTIDALQVRWRGDQMSTYGALAAGRRWEITEGDPDPHEMPLQASRAAAMAPGADANERERLVAFWDRQRAAMNALKVEKNVTKAIALFREALSFDPAHEDARYYLGVCLAAQGETEAALAEYETLTRMNAQSHRGLAAWGALRASTARSAADLQAAEAALKKAHQLNPEETGALLRLGEVALLRGDRGTAEQRFVMACRTNTRATGGFFLRGYVRWKDGDTAGAREQLEKARAALGPDWKPKGATAEGDVAARLQSDASPLSRFWETWDGTAHLANAFGALDSYLKRVPR